MATCPVCDGSGECPECHGSGHSVLGDLAANVPVPGAADVDDEPTCNRCPDGNGLCYNCDGTGEVEDDD